VRIDKAVEIISNKNIVGDYFELKIKAGEITQHCNPGQFFMITAPGVFLRRPISIHSIEGSNICFLYKVIGQGTRSLSEMQKGQLEILGALGNGYLRENREERAVASSPIVSKFPFLPSPTREVEERDAKRGEGKAEVLSLSAPFFPVLIAGGTGIASLYFLSQRLSQKGILYYGAKNKKDLLCLSKFKKLGWKVVIATEDGSAGKKGFITPLLEKDLQKMPPVYIYVCGPMPMIDTVIKIAKQYNLKGCASLEEKMACAVGNCQGCAVKIDGQNKMVCKDGPVFDFDSNGFFSQVAQKDKTAMTTQGAQKRQKQKNRNL
jgi:dihydroorotate dehydrogenase electron transfer subunit